MKEIWNQKLPIISLWKHREVFVKYTTHSALKDQSTELTEDFKLRVFILTKRVK